MESRRVYRGTSVDEGGPHGVSAGSDSCVALVRRIRDGDRSAEDELVESYSRGVFLIAVARTRNREAARDLSQEILMAVLQALRRGQIRESSKLAAFIQGTARNLINNYLRTQARRPECVLVCDEAGSTDPVEALELAERRRLVRQELRAYSTIDQQILLLSLVEGHSLAEVAKRLNLSHAAVRARKSR